MGHRTRTRALVVVVGVAVVALVASACTPAASPTPPPPPTGAIPAPIRDHSTVAYTILPPGNGNLDGPTSWHRDDQRAMYDSIDNAVAANNLTDADLSRYFKSQPLGGNQKIVRTEKLSRSLEIRWDAQGVPHVFGATDKDVAYGAGYAIAESRLLILEICRILGRSGVIEMSGSGGADLLNVLTNLSSIPKLNYSEAELQAQLDQAEQAAGPVEGPKLVAAAQAYTDGINGYLSTNPILGPAFAKLGIGFPAKWKITDIVASGILVSDIFGAGGGDEVGNANALGALVKRFGDTEGLAVYNDLRDADDPTATNAVSGTFPYPQFSSSPNGPTTPVNTVDPASVAIPDSASVHYLPGVGTPSTPSMSNNVVLAGSRTKDGHPIMDGGPQSGYFYPQLLFEIELQGGGYQASGIMFPGMGPWIAIGHSTNYAWTATAGGQDIVDQRVEKLCNPGGGAVAADSTYYEFDGACTAMTRPDNDPSTAWRTVHGPVTGRATVDGAPVAITRERTSRGHEAVAAVAFDALSKGKVTDASDFARVMSNIPMSFNWSYSNDRDIAFFHSGWFPVRHAGVSYDLPTWGTGQWEWQGILDWHQQPQEIDPPKGYIASWNSKLAPGWLTADGEWGVGATQRVDLLVSRTKDLTNATPATLVSAIQSGATADLVGQFIVPEILAVLQGTQAPNAQLETIRQRLAAYAASGAHRRDLNNDWFYDDPMTPFVDNLFEPLVHTVFDPTLGTAYMADGGVRRPGPLGNPPSSVGSAYQDPSWYSLVYRELQRVRGVEARPADTPGMCGGGDLATCQSELWKLLGNVAWQTNAAQLPWNQDVSRWTKWTFPERITFLPYIGNFQTMRWVNKPTYQQVVSFNGH